MWAVLGICVGSGRVELDVGVDSRVWTVGEWEVA